MNSVKAFQNAKDLSPISKELNPNVFATDPADPNSENLSSERAEFAVSSGTSHSEKAVSNNAKPSKLADELLKQVLVIDDDSDSALTIKACLESYKRGDNVGFEFQVIEVTTYIDPIKALAEFKPYYYDLLLVDINMPAVNGYELVEKIIRLDLNIKVCFMSSGEVNYEAIRQIHHPVRNFGCFIKKPTANDYLVNRVVQELF